VTKVTLSAASARPKAHTQIAANTSETQSFPLLCIVFVSHSSRPACLIGESFAHGPLAFVRHRLISAYRDHNY
jgi:hypothetical protein